MNLTLNLKVDNADESDVKAFTFLLNHLTHSTDGVARMMRKGQMSFHFATVNTEPPRTVTVTATKKG